MTPDFEYFIRMKLDGTHGHTWAGIFYFDLPVGLILMMAWLAVVRIPFLNNLPVGVSGRLKEHLDLDWRGMMRPLWIVILSLVAGAFTHVLWDSFTHINTIFTRNFPLLTTPLYFLGDDYPLSHMLQHVSTGVGLTIVVTIFFCRPVQPIVRKRSPAFWPVLIGITGTLAAFRFSFMDYEIKIGHVVVILIAAGMYALILTSAIFYRRYR